METNDRIESLVELLRFFEREIISDITEELQRIGRKVAFREIGQGYFEEGIDDYISFVGLDKQGKAILHTTYNDVAEKDIEDAFGEGLLLHWNATGLLSRLAEINIRVENDFLQTYTLIGKNGRSDMKITINDLIPLPARKYGYHELVNLICERDYKADWAQMGEEYDWLYSLPEHKAVDFFTIADTGMVVMPGTYLYPTALRIEDLHP